MRMALGARPRHILRAVGGDGLRTMLSGIALGTIAALVAGHFTASLLFETSPTDPAIVASSAALIIGGVPWRRR